MAKSDSSTLNLIYLDKNYPPGEIASASEFLEEHSANDKLEIRRVAILPKIINPVKNFPFSMNYFIKCYMRCLQRQDNVTLPNGDPKKLAKLLTIFFQTFRGVTFNSSFLGRYNFDEMVEIDFTNEHPDLMLPSNLEKALEKALQERDISRLEPTTDEVARLIELQMSLYSSSQGSQSADVDFDTEMSNGQIFADLVATMQQRY